MKRVAIIAGLVLSAMVMLVLALRIPAAEHFLTELPGVGAAFEWIAELAHRAPKPQPVAVAYGLAPGTSRADLSRARDSLDRLTGLQVTIRGEQLVVSAGPDEEPLRATVRPRRDPIRVFVVVYQSEELDRIRKALRTDEQAKRLALSVELDHVGYHLHAPSDMLYVNPDWAAAHHCTGQRLEGTGIPCTVTARDRFNAYVRGDAALFTDPHPDALATPAGRSFYVEDSGDAYELESTPVDIAPSQITAIDVAGDAVDLTLAPEAATAIAARATAPDIELVAELTAGDLVPVTVTSPGHIAFAVPDPAQVADELRLAALGLHQLN